MYILKISSMFINQSGNVIEKVYTHNNQFYNQNKSVANGISGRK